MFSPTREDVRRFFADAWAKRIGGAILTSMEQLGAEIVAWHPEYHSLLASGEVLLQEDYPPEAGVMNPFLHLSLHLAVEEQLSIDQPPGIVALFSRINARIGERHAALHEVIDCLGESIWRASRQGGTLDAETYLEDVRRRAR